METKKIIIKSIMEDYNDDMKLKEFDIEYEFINETWETSQAWGHKSTLLRNGVEVGSNKVRYYNRTWEEYRYKSCMSGCIRELISERYNVLLDKYKEDNNIKRATKKVCDTFMSDVLFKDRFYKEYKQVLEAL